MAQGLLLVAPVGGDRRADQGCRQGQPPPQPGLAAQLFPPGGFQGLEGLDGLDFRPAFGLDGCKGVIESLPPISGLAAEQGQQPGAGHAGIAQSHVDALGAHGAHRVGRISQQ